MQRVPCFDREQVAVRPSTHTLRNPQANSERSAGLARHILQGRGLARCRKGHRRDWQCTPTRRSESWLWKVSISQATEGNLTACRAGTFKQPLFAADGCTCTGIETVDGSKYHADKVILAAGAWTPALIDLEDQCVSKVCRGTAVSRAHPDGLVLGLGICSYPIDTR